MNSVNVVGNIGFIESKQVGDQTVTEIRLAVPTSKKDDVVWLPIELWGKTAEIAAQYLTKGRKVGFTGELRQQNWEKDGEKRSKLYLKADKLHFVSSANDGQSQTDSQQVDDLVDAGSIPF